MSNPKNTMISATSGIMNTSQLLPFSAGSVIDAEKLNERLKLIQSGGGSQVVWIREEENSCRPILAAEKLHVCGFSLVQRICIWVATFFISKTSAQRYFVGVSALQSMSNIKTAVIQLHEVKPELVSRFMHCWAIYKNQFGYVDSDLQLLTPDQYPKPKKPSAADLQAAQSPTQIQSLIGQCVKTGLVVKTPSKSTSSNFSEGLIFPSSHLVSPPSRSPILGLSSTAPTPAGSGLALHSPYFANGTSSISSPCSAPSFSYSLVDLVGDFVQNGLLAQALWVVKTQSVDLWPLEGIIEPRVMQWLLLNRDFVPAVDQDLDSMALSSKEGALCLGWGYKSANLMRMQTLAGEANKRCKTCSVQIPSFLPVGDLEIQYFIKSNYPQLEADWQEFLSSFSPEQLAQFKAKNSSLLISPEASAILARIQDKIREQFAVPYYSTPQLQSWLKEQNPQFVIIRSTGKEDSDTNSNAGGNASIQFIEPNAAHISRAIGEVIASYFGEKSLLQRFAAYDTSVFTEAPFMPVLIQEMVGESVGGVGTSDEAIPRSGVMFTLSGGKASGLTELYVGLGNNEGVVTSQVMTDHYLMDGHGGVASVVQPKNTRFVAIKKAAGKYSCEAIQNKSDELCKAPALPNSVALDMKYIADYFSASAYGTPIDPKALDMEFTIQMEGSEKPVIYLLQARPLVKVKQEQAPSYIDLSLTKSLSPEEKVAGKVLLDGGAYVRSIHSDDEILVCETIKEAQDIFLTSPSLTKIKTVVIQKPAPGTSHEAVNFRLYGVGVVVVKEQEAFERIREWTHNLYHTPVLVDMQRGLVIQKPKVATTPIISSGYICYPLPLEYSMKASKMITGMSKLLKKPKPACPATHLVQQILKDEDSLLLEEQFNRFKAEIDAVIEACKGKSSKPLYPMMTSGKTPIPNTVSDLLDIMATGKEEDVRLACATLLRRLSDIAFSKKMDILSQTRIELIMVLENIHDLILTQVMMKGAKAAPNSLERLYPIRLIEACLFQKEGDVVGGLSWHSVQYSIKNQNKLLSTILATGISVADPEAALENGPMLNVAKSMLDPTKAEIWKSMLLHMQGLPSDDRQTVVALLMSFDKQGILCEWANAHLVKLLDTHGIKTLADISSTSVSALFTDLAAQAKAAAQDLAYCKQMRQDVAVLHQQMGTWMDPTHVEKHTPTLEKMYKAMGFERNGVASPHKTLALRYKEIHPLAKFAFLSATLEAVRGYDEVIKACKGSSNYTSHKFKATHVKGLLNQYHIMTHAVMSIANEQGQLLKLGIQSMPVSTYINYMENGGPYMFGFHKQLSTPGFNNIAVTGMDESAAMGSLLPSLDFDVSNAIAVNKADLKFSIHWPETLEDYFTFFHQNMEAVLGCLKTQAGFNEEVLPKEIYGYCKALATKMKGSGSISSINVDGDDIVVEIDIPLRQHAAKACVRYNRQKPDTVHTRIDMFGNPEHQRWELTASAAALIGTDMTMLKSHKPLVDFKKPKGSVMSFEMTGATDAQQFSLITFLSKMADYSMGPHTHPNYVQAVQMLRQALGYSILNPSEQDFANGGFYLGLHLINTTNNTNKALARTMLGHLENAAAKNPALGTVPMFAVATGVEGATLGTAIQKLKIKVG